MQGQVEFQGEVAPETPAKRLGGANFRTIAAESCAVRYSQGALDRASHLLKRLEVLTYHFNRWGDAPMSLAVYLLHRDEWNELGLPLPFGVPVLPGRTAILAPAEGDDGTVELWQQILGADGLPPLPGTPLRGEYSHVRSLIAADVMLQVEASREFVRRAQWSVDEPWMQDLVAQVVARTVHREHEEERLPELDVFWDRVSEQMTPFRAPLELYDPNLSIQGGDAGRRWLWYQAQLQQAAELIVARDKNDSVYRLQRLTRKGRGTLRWNSLIERYPALVAWRGALQPAPS